jgi:hypothetical protein
MQAQHLTEGIPSSSLFVDKGYDTDEIVTQIEARGIKVVIPPKSNRKIQREYDKGLYEFRPLLKTLSFTLNDGVELPQDMLKIQHLF